MKKTPTAIRLTLEVSKMPNQRMNNGTQAMEGIARRACSVGPSSLASLEEYPVCGAEHRACEAARDKTQYHPRQGDADVREQFTGRGQRIGGPQHTRRGRNETPSDQSPCNQHFP